jgi:hypothetical protein
MRMMDEMWLYVIMRQRSSSANSMLSTSQQSLEILA